MSNCATPDRYPFDTLPTSQEPLDQPDTDFCKIMSPSQTADIVLAIQVEKMRVSEAITARDTAVHRLEDAYISVRQKAEIIDKLSQEVKELKKCSMLLGIVAEKPGRGDSRELPDTIHPSQQFSDNATVMGLSFGDDDKKDAQYENSQDSYFSRTERVAPTEQATSPTYNPVFQSNSSMVTHTAFPIFNAGIYEKATKNIVQPNIDEPECTISLRQTRLATLPLPFNIPDDALKPILIPPPYTLHEFISNASGSLKTSLSNYRVLQELTTYWCPEREEHGYFLTPVFKCSTNPRVITAHRWSAVDVVGKMIKPTECFYNKDGKWYYAGVYKAFKMDDITIKEWDALSTETTQAIVKETIAGRKNVSPQNLYEIAQLYAAGALKVACIGLQCIGFSNPMYRTILEQANNCTRTGKWKTTNIPSAGTPWTPNTLNVLDGLRLNTLTPTSATVSVIDEDADGLEY